MKKLFLILLVATGLLSCNKLKDVELNDNPYDEDYQGPKVVTITNVIHDTVSTSPFLTRNILKMQVSIDNYENVKIYRDGISVSSNSFVTSGTTYTYQASATFGAGETQLSDPYIFTTP